MKKTVYYFVIYASLVSSTVAGMVENFMDSCEKGSMQGCYQAGVVYWTGEGATKNIKIARSLLEISCEGGFDDACVALRTMNGEDIDSNFVKNRKPYSEHVDGKLQGDIDQDGKMETVAWKKFASVDLGDYYQLLVIDDDGSLFWEGPKEKDDANPLVFSSLDFGISMPQLLIDFDHDGSMELLTPLPQSDVSPTYFRKLRWRGTYFEPLLSNALMLSIQNSNQFVWKTTLEFYGTWISKLSPSRDGLVKADVTQYNKDESVRTGKALIKFHRNGATVHRWIEPITSTSNINTQSEVSSAVHKTMGLVYGLDPQGDGFLSIRKKPKSIEIGRLYNGDKVEILSRSGKWYKIKDIKSGRVGWSHSNWISIDY